MSDRFGLFSGEPETRWLSSPLKGRLMVLTEEFSFTEASTGRVWTAPKGLVVDGASIPRALWTMIGSPFTGNYRRASVVHDKACLDFPTDGPERKAADAMFYAACRAGGCGRWQAKVLYLGVRIGSTWAKAALVEDDDDAIWLELSAEDAALQERFKVMARQLDEGSAAFVDEGPEAAVAEVDAVLRANGFPA